MGMADQGMSALDRMKAEPGFREETETIAVSSRIKEILTGFLEDGHRMQQQARRSFTMELECPQIGPPLPPDEQAILDQYIQDNKKLGEACGAAMRALRAAKAQQAAAATPSR